MDTILEIIMFFVYTSLILTFIGAVVVPIIGYTLIGLFYLIMGFFTIADFLTPQCLRDLRF